MLLCSMLLVQCASDGGRNDGMADSAEAHGGVAGTTTNGDPATAGTYTDEHGNVVHTDGTVPAMTGGTVTTTTVVTYTPAKERMMVTNDMRGLRSLLMADLEVVRTRLNDGARTVEAREADKALAADLAQGLERVDRALAALGEADDATWASMRDVQLKEVAEVRSWMADYRAKETWASK